ncbi:MAG: serine hydrolase domain-containing protein [Hyphomonadaceae bacterium]
MSAIEIAGDCDPSFSRVTDVFRANFEEHGDIGASLCIYRDGQKIIDLWGGHADKAKTRPWTKDTLVNLWSTTKGIMSLCVARLNDQGLIANDQPVARYWPECAAGGKQHITVGQLFSHQAGLCGTAKPVSEEQLLDTRVMAALLAAETPHWPPGSRSGYHALSIGPLADGLFLSVTGKTVGQYFRDEIARPLGIDFHMGVGPEEDARIAQIVHDGNPMSGGPDNFNEYQRLAQINIPVKAELANVRAWRAQGTPSAGGQGNGRSIAQIYGALAYDRRIAGVEIVSEKALAAATSVQIENEDLVLRFPMSWGVGFALNRSMQMYGPNATAFGHHGWGGSFGFADPKAGIGVGYAMNFMREPQGGVDPRFAGLLGAIYQSI